MAKKKKAAKKKPAEQKPADEQEPQSGPVGDGDDTSTGGATTDSHPAPKSPDLEQPDQPENPETPDDEDGKPEVQYAEALRCTFMASVAGESRVAMRTKAGGEVQIPLVDGVFERPEEADDGEWRAIVRELLATGEWEDISVVEKAAPKAPEPVVHRLFHPDNEPDNPKQGTVHVETNAGEVVLDLDEDGVVKTESDTVAAALKAKGYLDVGDRPKE